MHYSRLSLRGAFCCVSTAALFAASTLHADVKMPSIFGDHMVLQGETKLPVWGTADPDEEVTVTFGDATAKTKTDASGKWRVDLAPAKINDQSATLTVTGKNSLKFEDVVVGDVWICSGQSNMEFGMTGAHNAAEEIPKANDPLIRLFLVPHVTALEPKQDVAAKWVLCSPETLPRFSAPGYFFGKDLRAQLKRPIGLIGTYWGGTPAQSWTSLAGLKSEPVLSDYVQAYDKFKEGAAKLAEGYPERKAAYDEAIKKWNEEDAPALKTATDQYTAELAKAKADKQSPPPKPTPAHPKPTPPASPDGTSWTPTALYNAMVAPLEPFAIKGVIWYQGESNANKAAEYATLFPTMIKNWRENWGQGDFPFIFVQLAGFAPGGANWPFLRDSQFKTLSLPNTGMATAVDIGDPGNIHPKDKLDVGHRLALAARHVAYGEDNVYSGPLVDSAKFEGGKAVITFKSAGSGLVIGVPPWNPAGKVPPAADVLKGFIIAGDDQKWEPAEAKIDGDKVIVSSAKISKPVAVRYDWDAVPDGNLYNKENLPAPPFRTDSWPQPQPPVKPQASPSANANTNGAGTDASQTTPATKQKKAK